jgi:hypothetical protein
MKDISDLIARKEYLPATEDIQQELADLFGETRKEEDSLIQNFASGMLSGAITAPLSALGPLGAMAAPSIMSAVGGRTRNVHVLNSDGATKLLTKSKHKNKLHNPKEPKLGPGKITYITGIFFAVVGAALSETPIGPILIGIGAGMMGSGISLVGEDIAAAQPRYPQQLYDQEREYRRERERELNRRE